MEMQELARRYVISTACFKSPQMSCFPPHCEKQVVVLKSFPLLLPEHYATVILNFVPALGQTELQLDCKGVPVCKEENMKFCWQKQHFEEIKGLLQLTTLNG